MSKLVATEDAELAECVETFMKDIEPHEMVVLLNRCYGGWSPSKSAIELYNAKLAQRAAAAGEPAPEPLKHSWNFKRHDPTLVEVWCELGDDFDEITTNYKNEPCHISKTRPTKIDKKYEKFYHISEYDGMETIDVHYDSYYRGRVKQILDDDELSDGEKICALRELNNEPKDFMTFM